jgi:hypothetical protein
LLRIHHVAHVELGNCIFGCDLLFEGDVVSPLPMASVAMMKYFDGSSARPGPMR